MDGERVIGPPGRPEGGLDPSAVGAERSAGANAIGEVGADGDRAS